MAESYKSLSSPFLSLSLALSLSRPLFLQRETRFANPLSLSPAVSLFLFLHAHDLYLGLIFVRGRVFSFFLFFLSLPCSLSLSFPSSHTFLAALALSVGAVGDAGIVLGDVRETRLPDRCRSSLDPLLLLSPLCVRVSKGITGPELAVGNEGERVGRRREREKEWQK